jgi:hypothetical protein
MRIAWLLAVLGLAGGSSLASEPREGTTHLIGHYTDDTLANYGRLTLPRTFLYDSNSNNKLVPADRWPAELKNVRKNMGDAFCCVSEDTAQKSGSGPPVDCVKIIYGENVATSFDGLLDAADNLIRLDDLPSHKYLIVEYAAQWCAPCLIERKSIERFFKTSANAANYAWITIDMTRFIDVQSKQSHSPN